LESDEELLNQLFNFNDEKENEEKIQSANLPRQLFKVIESENNLNIHPVNYLSKIEHVEESKKVSTSEEDDYWSGLNSENRKRKFSFFNKSNSKQVLEGNGFATKKFKSLNY